MSKLPRLLVALTVLVLLTTENERLSRLQLHPADNSDSCSLGMDVSQVCDLGDEVLEDEERGDDKSQYSQTNPEEIRRGLASWYGGFHHGRLTANGETFDETGFTTAHRTLAFDTWLCIRNLVNSSTVRVRVTDRGPALWTKRELDLSRAAFEALAPLSVGVIEVEYWICE